MSYMSIENLYRPKAQQILAFRWVYAMEKIHGTSAHIRWDGQIVHLFPGGTDMASFANVFETFGPSVRSLSEKFTDIFGESKVTIFGEAYGGKCQGMKDTYGPALRFVAFEAQVGDLWLDVPKADDLCQKLGIPFVWYEKVLTDITSLDVARDRPSTQAKRNGILEDRIMEGVVLRPPFEVTLNDGSRLIAKHKRAEFGERKTEQKVVDPAALPLLQEAEKIAEEWVTERRLEHVLDKLGNPTDFSAIPAVITAMIEDVTREASGEILDSKAARKAISAQAVKIYKARIMRVPT